MTITVPLNLNNALIAPGENDRGLVILDEAGLSLISGYNLQGSLDYTPFDYLSTIAKIDGLHGGAITQTATTALLQHVHLVAGSSLIITGLFAPESTNNDFAFVLIGKGTADVQGYLLADKNSVAAAGGKEGFSYTITVNVTGDYNIVLGSADAVNHSHASDLMIQSIAIALPTDHTSPTLNGLRLDDGSQILANGTFIAANGLATANFLSGGGQGILSSLISQDGGGIISHDIGGIISHDSGGIISHDAGGIISHDSGGIISHDAGGLRSVDGGSIISDNSSGVTGAGASFNAPAGFVPRFNAFQAVDPAAPDAPIVALTKSGSEFAVVDAEGLDHNIALHNGNFASFSLHDLGGSEVRTQLQLFDPTGAKIGGPIENLAQPNVARASLFAATLSDGRIAEVHQNTGTFGAFGTIYNQDGSVSIPTFTISNIGVNDRPAALLALNDGGLVVAINRYTGGDGTANDFLEVLNSDGTVRKNLFLPAYAIGDMDGKPSLTQLADGSILLVDKSTNPGGLHAAVFDSAFMSIRTMTLSGGNLGSEIPFESNASVAALNNGDFVVFFHISGNNNGPLMGQVYHVDGTRVGSAIILPGDNATQVGEHVLALPEGGFVVAYVESPGTASAAIRVQSYYDNGHTNGEFVSIPFNGEAAAGIPQMSLLENGKLSVIYNSANGHDFGQLFALNAPAANTNTPGDSATGSSAVKTINTAPDPAATTTDATYVDAYGNTVVDTTDTMGRLVKETVTGPAPDHDLNFSMTIVYALDGTYHAHSEQKTTAGSVISDADYGQHGEINSTVIVDGQVNSTNRVTFNSDGSYTRHSVLAGLDGFDDVTYGANGSFVAHTHTDGQGNVTVIDGPGQIDSIPPTVAITGISGTSHEASHVISGTIDVADKASDIVVRNGLTVLGTASADSQGHWSLPFKVGGSGVANYEFSASARDSAGNTGISNTQAFTVDLAPVSVAVQTAGGVDLSWNTLYNEMANSPIGGGGTASQYTSVDIGAFNGQSAPIKFVVTGTGFTYSGSFPDIQLTGGTITGIQEQDSSNHVLADFTGFSISATAFNEAMATYVAGAATPDPSGLLAIFMAQGYNAIGGNGADKLQGGNFANAITGGLGNDIISGGAGDDVVYYTAGDGADTIDGGTSTTAGDKLAISGTAGDDTLAITTTGGAIIGVAGGSVVNVEHVTIDLLGGANDTLVISGTASNDALGVVISGGIVTGLAGSSVVNVEHVALDLLGGASDTLDYADTLQAVTVNLATASATGFASIAGVENVTGGAGNDTLIGNALANVITGSGGIDVLDGGAGADTMIGGQGDDTYFVDNVSDSVSENLNEGNDGVHTLVDFTIGANVEALILDGTAINGAGNSADNAVIGNASNNIIDGKAGADLMVGAAGNDIYFVDNAGDSVVENLNEGNDIIHASIDYTIGTDIESLILDGTTVNGGGNSTGNAITGNAGNNIIDGKGGADLMQGGAGDDIYFVDNAGDAIVENANEGNDIVHASIDYTIGANIESLILDGSTVSGDGNSTGNAIIGNAANNIIDGKGGADLMQGGAGDDIYFVDNAGDSVVENANEGNDIVHASIDYTIGANIESLILDGTTVSGDGNSTGNAIIGNSANNIIDGKGGADLMQGGAGDDIYFVDNAGDSVMENPNEGNDIVHASIDYTIGANIESLILDGTVVNGAGNSAGNALVGNVSDNNLDGRGGADFLIGNGGNDTFIFQAGEANGDVIADFAGSGASVGDSLNFVGFGTTAQGATFTQLGATNQWQIHSGLDGHNEVITLQNSAVVNLNDYLYV